MSFLSDILPLWSHTADGEGADQELTRVSEKPKTWTAVKLPSIPIELSDEMSRPCSRAVRTATKRDDNCLFCGNSPCKANQQAAEASGQEKHKKSRARASRDSKLFDVSRKAAVFGNTQSEISPRSLQEHTVRVRSASHQSRENVGPEKSNSSWEPFSCKCQFCGEKFGKHSVAIHERRCSKRRQIPTTSPKQSLRRRRRPQESSQNATPGLQKVATIVTMGLNSGIEKSTVYATLPPRPLTRTLSHSELRSSGYGVPLASKCDRKFKQTNSSVQCEQCQQIVATDRVSIHQRLCKPSLTSASPCDVVFPVFDHLRVDESRTADEKSPPKHPKKPPTKVCYICGREFGSHSIAIHEPQCLRKWQTENRKLPISERRPLPKRQESKPTVVRTLSGDALGKIDSLPAKDEGLKEKLVQLYFENCYSEFEKELVPCKKCHRTFAPERHKQHEQNCNAKPIIAQTRKNVMNVSVNKK